MGKNIDIEYCGPSGFGSIALRLKKAILDAFPDAEVNSHANNSQTGRIIVAVIDGGNKKTIWSNGKVETQGSHATIIANLKSS